MLKYVLLGATLAALGYAQDRDTVVHNVDGYKMERAPTYLVVTPRKIRPNQVIQVFATMLKLEYSHVNMRVSVVKDGVSYGETEAQFTRPASYLLQLQIRSNAQPGDYKIRVEGSAGGKTSGNIFVNETSIEFSAKQASVFIQLNKPIFRQGQKVFFRIIPIMPNLMPKYGSMTVYVKDPTGFTVRRWLTVQTNAGGIVSLNFTLADQPNYGNWTIQVDAFGFLYNKSFLVEEYWDPRFDVNVTVKPYILDNVQTVGGVINANMTTGKPIEGNATVMLTVIPAPDPRYINNPIYPEYNYKSRTVQMQKFYSYVNGPLYFDFSMEEIKQRVENEIGIYETLENFEMIFNVSVRDWFFEMQETGFASTILVSSKYKLQWIGDKVRTFKPESVLTVQVAVMTYDGRPVTSKEHQIHLSAQPQYGTGGSGSPVYIQPKTPLNGITQFEIPIDKDIQSMKLMAILDEDRNTLIEMMTYKFYSPSNNYIILTTSTVDPKINEYIIFHVKLSNFVPRIYYQVIAGGNIIVGDELEMISRRKTFAVALSREMVPTARVIVYYVSTSPEEIVVDSLSFFVSGTKSNTVTTKVNRGKDFTKDTIEIIARSDPGSYIALAAMPNDLYSRGINDGLTEYNLIDELNTYDQPARGSWQHLWRKSETEFEYKFFTATGFGIDTNTTFKDAGLLALSDVTVNRINNDCWMQGPDMLPCFDGSCYHRNRSCDGIYDCQNDWADEQNCPVDDPRFDNRTEGNRAFSRVSRILRFYEDSSWAWKEIFTKPDGEVDFRVTVPKYPLTWVLNTISVSRNLGLGLMESPVIYSGARYMYIIVESPTYIVRGEQIGVRVTVFNYWPYDDFIEVLVTMEGSPDYDSVLVGDEGFVTSYNPATHSGEHQTLVFLEPYQSKDIFLPIVPKAVRGNFTFTVRAWCFIERDTVSKTVYIKSDGIENYYHTPYLIDLIRSGSMILPEFKMNTSDQFVIPDYRYHAYVPGSPKAVVSIFGDIVTPGFFQEYLTAEDILHRPYGAGEMNMFNFAYNLLTLKFMKANEQLSDKVLKRTLSYLNIALQRQLSYMNTDGSFRMFRDDNRSSIWLTAFVAKTLHEARFGEWEKDLFIPLELINTIVLWLCDQQNNVTGEFDDSSSTPIYDRTYGSLQGMKNQVMMGHPVPLTAYVLIALYQINDVTGKAQSCIDRTKWRAAEYLSRKASQTDENMETFHLAITAYALALTQQRSRYVFDRLWTRKRTVNHGTYIADMKVPENPSYISNAVRYLKARLGMINDAYAVQSTAYTLRAHIKHFDINDGYRKKERDSLMTWLTSLRNSIGGMASSQVLGEIMPSNMELGSPDEVENTDTIDAIDLNIISMMPHTPKTADKCVGTDTEMFSVGTQTSSNVVDTLAAMEALSDYTLVDPNRNVFHFQSQLEASSMPKWKNHSLLTKNNYTHTELFDIEKVWGQVKVSAWGTGRAMVQLTETSNVEYPNQIRNTVNTTVFYHLEVEDRGLRFTGRNFSWMHMTPCVSWVYTKRSLTSGLSVLEIDVPTGYVVQNDTLRSYVKSGVVKNLKRAEFYHRKVVFYFDYLDQSKTCVYFQAHRWYPVANMTIQHRMRVYDYYEPAFHNTTLYITYNLFNLNVCYVCGSYQCPYCPFFNVATIIKASFTFVTLLVGFLIQRYLLRIT